MRRCGRRRPVLFAADPPGAPAPRRLGTPACVQASGSRVHSLLVPGFEGAPRRPGCDLV